MHRLDDLAREGARFTSWYGGAPVCSASRAALLTGCRPWRVNVPGNVPAAWDARGLAPDAATLPELLEPAGYRRFMSGKWHLGQSPDERPHRRGFEQWFGFLHGCVDYYSHVFYWCMAGGLPPRHDLWENDRELYANGQYITDLIADRAIAFLREAAASGEPFLLYVPFNNPHYPMQAPPEAVERFAHLPEDRKWSAALLWTYDQAVGRVLDALEELGLGQNTCVMASSDHGASREPRNWPDGRTDQTYCGGSTGGLRGAKFEVYEGGIRVPCLMRWPGVIDPGSVIDEPCTHADVLPTVLETVGQPIPDDIDGRSLLPLFRGSSPSDPRPLIWRFNDRQALRLGRWKMVMHQRTDASGPAPNDTPELYDLEQDPAESSDVSASHPKQVGSMRAMLLNAP